MLPKKDSIGYLYPLIGKSGTEQYIAVNKIFSPFITNETLAQRK
jgi:hypothetical protein